MKRNVMSLIGVLLMVAMLLSLTGCNKKETTPETPTEVTQQAVDSPYELNMKNYESFIKSLPAGGYYAFAAMDKDHDALLVTDAVFQDGDKTLASEATVYGYDKDGNIVEYGDVIGGGTAYPLSVKDNNLYFGNKTSMTKVTIEEYRNAMRIVDRQSSKTPLRSSSRRSKAPPSPARLYMKAPGPRRPPSALSSLWNPLPKRAGSTSPSPGEKLFRRRTSTPCVPTIRKTALCSMTTAAIWSGPSPTTTNSPTK